MRISKDIYIMPSGTLISISGVEDAPQNAKLYQGYDYDKQEWVRNGKKDDRTLADIIKDAKLDKN